MSYLFGSNLSIYFSVKKTIQSLFALIDTWPLCSISSLFRAHQRAGHILLESDPTPEEEEEAPSAEAAEAAPPTE